MSNMEWETTQSQLLSSVSHPTLKFNMTIVPSPAISTNPSAQLNAALQWTEAVSNADFDLLTNSISDDYIHRVVPASLNVSAAHGKEGIVQHYKGILPHFISSEVCHILILMP